mgnify:CR=1 FL=1
MAACDLINAKGTLNRLHIAYRELPCRNGWFYCCKKPDGISFDIKIDDQGIIRLWRFIGTAPLSKSGCRCEYRNPQQLYSAVGMEVTDEGDITFYAEQKIDATDDKCASRIDRMISCFINMISEVPLALAL